MPENRGNALGYSSARGHRPLPTRDTGPTIRPAHQPQEKKPSTFNWDWNKATCAGCQTKVTKSSLVDDQCPTCRGVEPVRAIRAQKTPAPAKPNREHSKTGDQVYEHLDDAAVRTRFEPAAPLPGDDTEPAGDAQDPSPVVELLPLPAAGIEPPPVSRCPLNDLDLLEECVQHAGHTLRAAHGIDDPLVGSLRTSALTALAALDFYLATHCTTTDPRGSAVPPHDGAASQTTQPSSLGLGGDQPAADPRGEARPRPARTPNGHVVPAQLDMELMKSRPRAVRRPAVDVDEAAVVLEYAAGDSSPTIARRHGVLPKRIRQILQAHAVQLRDDRARNSGRRPTENDTDLNERVRRLYVDQQLATLDVAQQLHIGRKRVTRILAVLDIDLRPAAHLAHHDLTRDDAAHAVELYKAGQSLVDIGAQYGVRAATIRDLVVRAGHPIRAKGASQAIAERLRDLQITAAQVKDWALETGLVETRPAGLVGRALIDAYLAAQQQDSALAEGTNPTTHPSGDV